MLIFHTFVTPKRQGTHSAKDTGRSSAGRVQATCLESGSAPDGEAPLMLSERVELNVMPK